ncbi:hypothetical protein [Streptomyces sp. NPDC059819]|uniref:hypothetical protein n=1 Tax=Streptomyces sp. NPDC059819 TaxID=3346963 RepID=UPI003649E09F
MSEPEWDQAELRWQLRRRYSLTVVSAQPLSRGQDTARWQVVCAQPRFKATTVVQYLTSSAVEAARAGLDMSELCRAADIRTAEILKDHQHNLMSETGDGSCSAACSPTARPLQLPIGQAQAEHLGMNLARLHTTTSVYRPTPADPIAMEGAWLHMPVHQAMETVEQAAACVPVAGLQARRRLAACAGALRDLGPRIESLRAQTRPEALTVQAVHGAYLPHHIHPSFEGPPQVTGFRATTAHLAWEVARIAYHPQTIAHCPQWAASATAFLAAYRGKDAAVPGENLLACARIALLHLVTTPPRSASLAAWETRTNAVQQLLHHLPHLDEAVRTIAGLRSHPV